LRETLGDGFDFSVTVAGDERGEALGLTLRRWGSVLGIQPDGLEVFTPKGKTFRFPAWSFERLLMSLVVRRGIYRGVRESQLPLT